MTQNQNVLELGPEGYSWNEGPVDPNARTQVNDPNLAQYAHAVVPGATMDTQGVVHASAGGLNALPTGIGYNDTLPKGADISATRPGFDISATGHGPGGYDGSHDHAPRPVPPVAHDAGATALHHY